MIINNKSDLKINEIELSHHKDDKLESNHEKIDFDKITQKNSHDKNIGVKNNIRKQVTSIDSQQRNIQDKISLIQSEELKISKIEKSLQQAKQDYMQAINNEDKKQSKYKNIIKEIVKQVDNIKKDIEGNDEKSNEEEKYDHSDLDKDINEYKFIDIINNTLREISNIKTKLSESKAYLISLEQMIEQVKAKIKNKEHYIEDYLDIIKYTKDVILTNPSKYMNANTNIISDIVVDIFY